MQNSRMVMMLELSPSISFAPKVIKLRLEYFSRKKMRTKSNDDISSQV